MKRMLSSWAGRCVRGRYSRLQDNRILPTRGGEGKEDGLWREGMDENFAINRVSPNHVLSPAIANRYGNGFDRWSCQDPSAEERMLGAIFPRRRARFTCSSSPTLRPLIIGNFPAKFIHTPPMPSGSSPTALRPTWDPWTTCRAPRGYPLVHSSLRL